MRRLRALVILAVCLAGLAASPVVFAQRVLVKLGTLAPEGSPWHDILLQMKEDWSRLSDGQVVVRISDSGPGIEAEHVDHVFDPGFTTKGVGVGTGLGLALSYRIMAQHGGEIRVDPHGGPGAVFEIGLPHNAGEIPSQFRS